MHRKILCVPEVNYDDVPSESIGMLSYHLMSSHDKKTVAMVDARSGDSYTYGDVLELSLNLASQLKLLGVAKNDIVGIVAENSRKYFVAAFSCFYLAAPVHLINPAFTTYELMKILNLSKPKLLFCSKASLKNLLEVKKSLDFVQTLIVFDDDMEIEKSGIYLYKDLVAKKEKNFVIENNVDVRKQVAYICNSSGTTGMPKGVMLSHHSSRISYAQTLNPKLYPVGRDRLSPVAVLPLYHIYGFNTTMNVLLQGGKAIILDKFEPQLYLESIEKYKANLILAVPSLINFLAYSNLVKKYDVSSIDNIYTAASPPKEDVMTAVAKKFNVEYVYQMYSLTELSFTVASTALGNKKGSCGKIAPGHQIKIIDTNTKEILGANESGEICIKGYNMIGYINDPEMTRETIDDGGFVHTGDVGYYDEEGYLFIIDRLKDLIKYKSYQVPPMELEEVIMKLPAVRDVAVVGKPDDRFGELAVAFVVKKEGEDIDEKEIVDHVASYLSAEKRLHGGVMFVKEIPRNNIGKILRKDLRGMF